MGRAEAMLLSVASAREGVGCDLSTKMFLSYVLLAALVVLSLACGSTYEPPDCPAPAPTCPKGTAFNLGDCACEPPEAGIILDASTSDAG